MPRLRPVSLMLLALAAPPAIGAALPSSALAVQRRGGGAGGAGGDQEQGQGGGSGARQEPRPYKDVITDRAVSDSGVFDVHHVGDRYYYEIPRNMFGRDFLMIVDQRGTIRGVGFAGEQISNRVVRWERFGNRVLLRVQSFAMRADTMLPVARAVQLSNQSPILMSFDVAAWNPDDSAAVIEAGRLFTSDVAELNLRQEQAVRVRRFDAARSMIERVKSFPRNVEVSALQTYEVDSVPSTGGRGGGGGNLNTITMLMNYSMLLLPDNPMRPRFCDDRIGIFGTSFEDYGAEDTRVPSRCFLARWRLEPRNPGAAVSDPVKPIIFYIDPATPEKWVPWLIKGVNAWEPVFRAAGFSNAIMGKRAPTPAEDPEFDVDDSRYSTIRWLPSTTQNAYGPHVSDPRTGEVLQSNIGFYHNVVNLGHSWYWLQAGAADPRARRLPLPDSLTGELVAYVAAHEVGHTIGLPHNQTSSGYYPTDSLRSPTYTKKNGTSYSIMDYARNNYVAQPGDNAQLMPIIGPWDYYTINWGYRRFPNAATPMAEKPILDSLARLQDTHPEFRYGADAMDPRTQSETLGDDAVKSTTFGLLNIKRLMTMLLPATTHDPMGNYDLLTEYYNGIVGQWGREMNHVAIQIGGVYVTEKFTRQKGPVYEPISRARQATSVKFLNENAFVTPTFLLDKDVMGRIEAPGTLDRVRQRQAAILGTLMQDARLARLAEQQAIATAQGPAYTIAEMFGDLRTGIFSELSGTGQIAVDPYRRNLQRTLIDQFERLVAPAAAPAAGGRGGGGGGGRGGGAAPARPGDAIALARLELRDIGDAVNRAIPRAADRETKAHLEDLRASIDKALRPVNGEVP